MSRKQGQRNTRLLLLALLLTCAALAVALWFLRQPTSPTLTSTPRVACSTRNPCLAIVIDDIGRDLDALEALVGIEEQLTFSVLPHGKVTRESVLRLTERKRETWLHLPLEPLDRDQISDEKIVLESTGAIGAPFEDCLAQVPTAVGITTHMGSRFTQLVPRLDKLMKLIAKSPRRVLDSRTTAKTKVCAVAKKHQIPCLERQVFMDDPNDSGSIDARIKEGAAISRVKGWAILVGHPLPGTIDSLQRYSAQGRRPRIVRLSDIPSW